MQKEKAQLSLMHQEYADSHQRRLDMRKKNFEQHEEDFFGGQKKSSQIKVIQKFIGKLKSENKNHQAILAELESLNMSKYVEEVSLIIASSINEKEIIFYTQVASKLNNSYENVPLIMIKDLVKVFNQLVETQEDNKQKIKAVFFFTVELFICGFSFSYKEIIDMIKKVFKCGKNKKNNSPSQLQTKLAIYCYSAPIFSHLLTQFGQTLTKRTPEWIQAWEKQGKQIFKFPEALPIKTKEDLTIFFSKYVVECHGLLKEVIDCIKAYQTQLFECLRLDGEFNKDTERNYVDTVQKFLLTKKHLKQISSSIREAINEEELQLKIVSIQEIRARYINKAENAQIFQDEFQKQIYENIPDLVTKEEKNITDQQYKQVKQSLDNCKNVNDSNEICKTFNNINNKKFRKTLAKDVLQYRKEYHLVTPYLCRIIAIVNINYKDIGETVNDLIFNQYEKIKDSVANNFVTNDKKSRILKYICEFTKFKVIDVDKTMACIENLMDNLNGYNIELLVGALENVGRFLHLSENSANKFTFLLKKYENIIKKKSLSVLTTSQLINSINLLKPRKQIQKPSQRIRTEEESKAEEILKICVLDKIDDLIKQIDTLMKTDQGFDAIKIEILKKIQSFDYINSFNYAYLLDQLNYSNLSNFVVDRTIQNLLLYLASGQNQKTILWAKFLAELYKYNLLQRPLLFSTIENAFKINENNTGIIHTFCYIFQSCIGYLGSKKISKNNERFLLLVKFKNFLSTCKYIPMLEEFQIMEMFDEYEPDLGTIAINVLNQFIVFADAKIKKENKEISYSEELDRYLSRNHLKKYEEKVQSKDTRGETQQTNSEKLNSNDAQKNNFIQQSRLFQKELTMIMEENRKDFSSRIGKRVNLQKVFDKKKDKKRQAPCFTVIGRSGTRFIKKDVLKSEEEIKKGSKIQ